MTPRILNTHENRECDRECFESERKKLVDSYAFTHMSDVLSLISTEIDLIITVE